MKYSDDFLVEKLRQILLRLYPTPQTSQIVDRNSKLFVTDPELMYNSPGNQQQSQSFPTTDSGYSQVEDEVIKENVRAEDIGVIRNESDFDRVNSTFVEGSYTLTEDPNTGNESSLTKNLHEFIRVLKISLGGNGMTSAMDSGTTGSNEMPKTVENSRDIISEDHLQLNLTLDDITDLNTLLSTTENVLQPRQIVIICVYVLIAIVSVVGNLLVVQLVIRSRRLHTVTHALLTNMAVADLCLATFNIPFTIARITLSEWPFGSILCHAVPFVQVTSVYVTSFTMVVIALDRYWVIMNPLARRLKTSQGVCLILAIWILSALLSLPYAIHHKVVRVLTMGVKWRCQAEYDSIISRRWLTIGTFLAQYLIPLTFTSIAYVSIMRKLRTRPSDLGSTTPRQVEAQAKAKKKTIKMLVLTVAFFAVSWAPINIYHLLTHFLVVRHNSTALLICHLIAMSSCTVNPFIYCWLNDHFRREAVRWARCFRTKRYPVIHPGVEINGVLSRADRTCQRTHSATCPSSSCRSPRVPNSQMCNRNHKTQQYLSPSQSSSPSTMTGKSTVNRRFVDSPIPSGSDTGEWEAHNHHPHIPEVRVLVKYTQKPESLFLVRVCDSYEEDLFASATEPTDTFPVSDDLESSIANENIQDGNGCTLRDNNNEAQK